MVFSFYQQNDETERNINDKQSTLKCHLTLETKIKHVSFIKTLVKISKIVKLLLDLT